jgi:uncharacterized membrane protein YkvA (DUF1232 family)
VTTWQLIIGAVAVCVVVLSAGVVWLKRTADRQEAALLPIRAQLGDLIRLPGRLRRVAADPRTPRRARWLLAGLALYVASPIDPIPDFLPGIGFLDEAVVVPLVLARVRRMIPAEVWTTHFPERAGSPRSAPPIEERAPR